jgi:hypothetical protein
VQAWLVCISSWATRRPSWHDEGMPFHLAQVNIALPREPLTAPLLADFVAQLEPINALADRSPGFVWRLQTPEGDATGVKAFGDDRIIVNMSVWESLDALTAYVYRSDHVAVMKQRRRWFEPMQMYMALWWVPAGELPSVRDAEERLEHLRAHGPSPHAFTFRTPFPPPGVAIVATSIDPPTCPSP